MSLSTTVAASTRARKESRSRARVPIFSSIPSNKHNNQHQTSVDDSNNGEKTRQKNASKQCCILSLIATAASTILVIGCCINQWAHKEGLM